MNQLAAVICVLIEASLAAQFLPAQAELVKGDAYPAEFEFRELGEIGAREIVTDGKKLQALPEAPLAVEAGFQRYDTRTYALIAGGMLKIEFLELKDQRASFSMLTLLRNAAMQNGPPGDTWAELENGIIFSQDNYLVRLAGQAPLALDKRIATSISNRIGRRSASAPLLISHFPQKGYDPSSLHYFLGPRAVALFAPKTGLTLHFQPEMELAQARYSLASGAGTFWLANFPTSQMAEDYIETVASLRDVAEKQHSPIYAKRSGPLIGLIEGNLEPGAARELLDSLQFTYSIKWIYEKNQHTARTIWGVPMGVLGTVVRSLLFTTLLCLGSIVAGVSFALFRLALRGYAPHNYLDRPERTEMIRLKLNEN
jgi:hypothetical protein